MLDWNILLHLNMYRVVNKFSWHKRKGNFAAEELYNNLSKEFGLCFEIINPQGNGNHPDAWVHFDGKHIALAEVKMVEYQSPRFTGVRSITTHDTVRRQISKAKKQLRSRETDLPRVLYLVCDASFTDDEVIAWAIFGPLITVIGQDDRTIYSGYRGLHAKKRMRQDDKFLDGLLSAIICVREYDDRRLYSVFQNMTSARLPDVLVPANASVRRYYGHNSPPSG